MKKFITNLSLALGVGFTMAGCEIDMNNAAMISQMIDSGVIDTSMLDEDAGFIADVNESYLWEAKVCMELINYAPTPVPESVEVYLEANLFPGESQAGEQIRSTSTLVFSKMLPTVDPLGRPLYCGFLDVPHSVRLFGVKYPLSALRVTVAEGVTIDARVAFFEWHDYERNNGKAYAHLTANFSEPVLTYQGVFSLLESMKRSNKGTGVIKMNDLPGHSVRAIENSEMLLNQGGYNDSGSSAAEAI